ncbi:MarR family winged helix-turn-helix transcriptional regulator [Pseudonocardia acidicola]|uniref:MarR family winged helix-turn-helix transcriptional regulator n=1 Tax=Pseudonocardia acidicola TaxID=2724939 RepID=UPI001B7D1D56
MPSQRSTSPHGDRATLPAAVRGPGPLARRLYQLHARLWQDVVGEDLTGPQFNVLSVLDAEGPMDQRTLGGHASLDKSTIAPIVERLRQRRLVDVAWNPQDKRRKLLQITPEGRELVTRLTPLADEVGDRMLAPLEAHERDLVLTLLQRIVEQRSPAQDPNRIPDTGRTEHGRP